MKKLLPQHGKTNEIGYSTDESYMLGMLVFSTYLVKCCSPFPYQQMEPFSHVSF